MITCASYTFVSFSFLFFFFFFFFFFFIKVLCGTNLTCDYIASLPYLNFVWVHRPNRSIITLRCQVTGKSNFQKRSSCKVALAIHLKHFFILTKSKTYFWYCLINAILVLVYCTLFILCL